MIDDVSLRYILKQRVEQYNKDQKSLHFNSFIFKFSLILVIFVSALIFLFLFVIPILTPFFMNNSVLSDALAIMCSGCMTSGTILIFIIYIFKKRKKARQQQKQQQYSEFEDIVHSTTQSDNSDSQDEFGEFADNKLTPVQKPKKSRYTGFFRLGPLAQELVKELFSFLFSSVNKPDYIYLDENKINFSLWLFKELLKHNRYLVDLEVVQNEYKDWSNTWLNNVIKDLITIQVIHFTRLENGEKIIMLNLDFYNPDQ